MTYNIEIIKRKIGDEKIETVSARDLHQKLEVKWDFSTWIKRRLNDSQLVEGQDFISLHKTVEREIGATKKVEYYVTLDSAKHLSMLERNEVGRKIRQYFINVEKKAREAYKQAQQSKTLEERAENILKSRLNVANLLEVPKHLAMQEAVKEVERQTYIDYTPMLALSTAMDIVKEEEEYLEISSLTKMFGLTKGYLNRLLATQQYQRKVEGEWLVTKYGKNHSIRHAWKVGSKTGYNYKWQVSFIRRLLAL